MKDENVRDDIRRLAYWARLRCAVSSCGFIASSSGISAYGGQMAYRLHVANRSTWTCMYMLFYDLITGKTTRPWVLEQKPSPDACRTSFLRH